VSAIVKSPLLDVIVRALSAESALQAASECLGTICRETHEVDENLETIQLLLPRVAALRPEIQVAVAAEDGEQFRALTRVFADAGDAWTVLVAREPSHFRPVVDALLECAARDKGREVISLTFEFWYELKQFLVLDRYQEAKAAFLDVYAKLVEVLLQLLQYPQPDDGDDAGDLFEGDREEEEKFREFRHQMGDTLKDACAVIGVSECLAKVLEAIKLWMQKYGSQATATSVPHWQELEAALFAMRAMGRVVSKDEETVLPQLIPLLVQIPPHEKLRFAAVMVLGRYTEWTAAHPEFLEPQFTYIVSSFQTDSKEIIRAAAQSVKFFCLDCKDFLGSQVLQLQSFYDQILDKLPETSQEEITEGVAVVVGAQKTEDIYRLLKLYCDPLLARLMTKARSASSEEGKLAVAGKATPIPPMAGRSCRQLGLSAVRLTRFWQIISSLLPPLSKMSCPSSAIITPTLPSRTGRRSSRS
jgi:transportin-3